MVAWYHSSMRYLDAKIPTAGPEDLASAFSSSDPMHEIGQHIADLGKLEEILANEKAMWQRAQGAAELATAGARIVGEAPKAPRNGVPVAPVAPTAQDAAAGDTSSDAPANRREAVLMLLREVPSRVWRTGDLVAELFKRQWSGEGSAASVANGVSQILGKLEEEGLAVKIRKGHYRLRGADDPLPTEQASDGGSAAEPSSTAEAVPSFAGTRTGSEPPGGSV